MYDAGSLRRHLHHTTHHASRGAHWFGTFVAQELWVRLIVQYSMFLVLFCFLCVPYRWFWLKESMWDMHEIGVVVMKGQRIMQEPQQPEGGGAAAFGGVPRTLLVTGEWVGS